MIFLTPRNNSVDRLLLAVLNATSKFVRFNATFFSFTTVAFTMSTDRLVFRLQIISIRSLYNYRHSIYTNCASILVILKRGFFMCPFMVCTPTRECLKFCSDG
jgi:hypothetical protein